MVSGVKMVTISENDLLSLYHQGLRGSAAGFALIGRQLASKLKSKDPDLASRLAELLTSANGPSGITRQAMPVDADSRQNLLKEDLSPVLDFRPSWDMQIEGQLEQIIAERENALQLIKEDLEPVKAVIFTGPPGVGKTLAAHWLAFRLNLPLYTLDLASVMSSLLGKTGSNIKAVIEHAKSLPCILFLDEFDAIAKKRDDEKDVGELKRLVNVLLQAIDEWPSTSLLIAATNHPDMLDPAVWRRFEEKINFKKPSTAMIEALLEKSKVTKKLASALSDYLYGQSYSDINQILLSARKKAVLTDTKLDSVLIEGVLENFSENPNKDERAIKIIHLALQGLSQRKIAEQLNVSHPTVGKVLREYKEHANG